MTRRALAVALAVATAGPAVLASGSHQPPATQGTPGQVFQATTLLVEVDVIVTDGDGRFVADLTAADFDVRERGVVQTIQAAYRVDGPAVAPLAGPVAPAGPMRERVPTALPPAVTVLFFDQDHLTQGAFQRLQAAAREFLGTALRPGDFGGVLVGGQMAGNRLTDNREELVEAVGGATLSPDATLRQRDLQDWPRMSDAEAMRIAVAFDRGVLAQVVDRAGREAGGGSGGGAGAAGGPDYEPVVMQKARAVAAQQREAAARTLTHLAALTRGLARIPGRKTVVLLSEGFWIEDAMASLRQIVGAAARSNVRIYALDARGMGRRRDGMDPAVMNPLETGAAIPTGAYESIEDGPNSLAVDTGGFVIRNTNAFGDALAEVARDTSRYYVLGYSPSDTTLDGSFREITVRVSRPGVTVRARKGYVAAAEALAPMPGPAPATAPAPEPPPAAAPLPGPLPAGPPLPEPPSGGAPAATGGAAEPATPPSITLRPDAATRVGTLADREVDGGTAATLASDGWTLYGQGDLEGAARVLGEAAALPGARPWVSYALGFAQFGLGEPREAARSWERVRREVPEFQAVYFDLADAYLQQSDSGRAVRVLRDAEARWPADPEVLNALGTVQVHREALGDAIETFQKAADAAPGDSLAYLNLARTYELRYYRMRRFSRPGARWMDNPADAKRSLGFYERYLEIGGPFEAEARTAVERLKWVLAIKGAQSPPISLSSLLAESASAASGASWRNRVRSAFAPSRSPLLSLTSAR